jgi:hypothetical protein
MAYEKKNKNQRQNSGWGMDVTFADAKLNAQEKDVFLSWLKTTDVNCIDCLEALIADSYRVSIKVDYNNDCTTVSLSQQDNKHRNSGLIIVSRAGSVDEAIILSYYKVFVLFAHQRLPTAGENESWG